MSSGELDLLPLVHDDPTAVSSSTAPGLPLELWQEIVNFLSPKTDRSGLRALSLVCSAFRILGQVSLFSHIGLLDQDTMAVSESSRFLSLIQNTPHLAPFVVSLKMMVMDRRWARHDFVEILSYLAHIQHLELVALMDRNVFQWLRYPGRANESLRMHTFPKLKSLGLFTLGGFPLEWILRACNRLEHLTVSDARYLPEDDAAVINFPHPLQSLVIDSISMDRASALVRALDHAGFNQIHSLVIGLPELFNDLLPAFHAPFLRHAASTLTHLNLQGVAWEDLSTSKHIENYHLENLPNLRTLVLEFYYFMEDAQPAAFLIHPVWTIGGTTSVWSFAAAVLNSAKKPHPFKQLEVVLKGPRGRAFSLDDDVWSEFDRSLAPNLCLTEFKALMFRLDLRWGSRVPDARVVDGFKARLPTADARGLIDFC